MFGLNKPEGEVSFELPDEDLSISEIASMLQKEGIVTQPLTFRLYATLKKVSPDSFFPGDYTLNTNMSYDEIFVAFRSGTGPEQVTLIFYEGWTLSDIADKLEENGVCKKEDLFRYLEENGAAFEEKYPFLADIPTTRTATAATRAISSPTPTTSTWTRIWAPWCRSSSTALTRWSTPTSSSSR